MTFPVVFRRAAQAEFDEAAAWYETQKQGLGIEFLAAVGRALDLISKRPELYPIVDGEVRRALVLRFPYCLYYRVKRDHVVVVAVFHATRNPTMWRRRR
jgi:plasmid stabilization system protein ParE